MPTMTWTEDDRQYSARWHSESGAAAPSRVVVVGDDTTANQAYRLALSGTGLMWRGDYHNARQLLTAIGRRIDRAAARREGDHADFAAHRAQRAERARVLGALTVQLDGGYDLGLRRAPDVRQACVDAYGEPHDAMCIALTELLGVLSARQWHEKGVSIPALDARIHPCYGVFSPVRGEYIDLAARAPLPDGARVAFDLGTGTGVLAAVLARRGMQRVTATDINPRAVECSRANIERLGYRGQVDVALTDLYPSGRADLIVCNPPWLPGRPTSALEQGVYDEGSQMLHGFLDGLAAHLAVGGEGWLILSDLAEHLGERASDHLSQRFAAAGLRVVDRLDTTPTHRRSKDSSDRFHTARSRERTSLWRLAADG
ncbi:class I SAM-dependent methyltransferase [Gordonia sp. HY002]|uniref:methyltransferase n=1 Tax=Gordonia zhenghanii TaxID=2911516 RepID=UPI001EF051E3|nr:class I SAM-dependent methyltransferase [Gordonia zhenghanii]MCF8569409.1 class I SAM-dependent methyltransferase [Gordonia zhenghanii]MCF8603586.1 class I SAM-dependent methyltransferase [Gordonia zhenghanii]